MDTMSTHGISAKKPLVRILHNMARSGGTVISRCLGSMDGVVLLSEIHPFGSQVHNPLRQANEWFHLFSSADLRTFQTRSFTFVEAVEEIRRRVEESGRQLVIRDWSHIDFTGVPFTENPSYRLTTAEILGQHYRIVHTSTVRHPLDQWLSLNRLKMFNDTPRPQARKFIHGYLRFAEFAMNMGYVRYEDFTLDSDTALRTLCERLQLVFDAGYKSKWHDYEMITGDNTTPSESPRAAPYRIQSLTRRSFNDGVAEELQGYVDYNAALELLGYQAD